MPDRPWPAAVDLLLTTPGTAIERLGPDRWAAGTERVTRLGADGSERSDHQSFLQDHLQDLAVGVGFSIPAIIGGDGPWLVTGSLPGLPAHRPDLHPEPGTLAGLIGAGLAALHAIAPPGTGGEGIDLGADGWAPIIERCRRAVEAGQVDSAALPEPYDRYSPDRLLEMLIDGAAGPGVANDSPVICHGSPTADRFVVDGTRFVGFDGLETVLVADRHIDLATAHLSVAEALGAEAVYAFYEGYGADPDLARLDRAVLAVRLLDAAARGR